MITTDIDFNNNIYQKIFNNSGVAMLLIENNNLISMINNEMEEFSGYARELIEGRVYWYNLLKYIKDESVKDIRELHNCFQEKNQSKNIFAMQTKVGLTKSVYLILKKISIKGQYLASLINVSEPPITDNDLFYTKYYDELTDVYKRSYLEKYIRIIDNNKKLPISIIMVDVNGLKLINDSFGHEVGDKILKSVANTLSTSCRKQDVIARWGGDEFIIILSDTDNLSAKKIVDRIKQANQQVFIGKIKPSIAVGYASKTNPKEKITNVLKTAENMMYKRKLMENESFRSSIIHSLEEILWEKDYETEEHAQRLKEMSLKLGKTLNLSDNMLDEIMLLAGLHDIGKIAIADCILLKPGPLTPSEWEIMKKHSEIGYRIACYSSELSSIANGIRYHHEWWNGTGYPEGLKKREIPYSSRIISVVDSFDVMVHDRPYKKAMTKKEAISEIIRCSGTQFDPEIAETFIKKVI